MSLRACSGHPCCRAGSWASYLPIPLHIFRFISSLSITDTEAAGGICPAGDGAEPLTAPCPLLCTSRSYFGDRSSLLCPPQDLPILRFGCCGCGETPVLQGRGGCRSQGARDGSGEEQDDHSPLLGTREPCSGREHLRDLGRSSCSTGRAWDRIRAASTENRDAALCWGARDWSRQPWGAGDRQGYLNPGKSWLVCPGGARLRPGPPGGRKALGTPTSKPTLAALITHFP